MPVKLNSINTKTNVVCEQMFLLQLRSDFMGSTEQLQPGAKHQPTHTRTCTLCVCTTTRCICTIACAWRASEASEPNSLSLPSVARRTCRRSRLLARPKAEPVEAHVVGAYWPSEARPVPLAPSAARRLVLHFWLYVMASYGLTGRT